ncbi:putative nucleic acid-binding Zn ribbon protein [Cryobacterium mesophilum]|uniref:FHA domain-containing protein n=1 Tax=Terrimesophilobacter mesophilus TaxID=433647 RepID=A0A4R8VD46_9MICO|nr:zinc-ribbon domain-containing protein [Terrimesophilobacter mesophilus]MBB5634001.1 putative nucleic acid-binding Zn ribbon protein [Terrimesophilobacter mesophilus]TFB80655.1 FHA domain-containing protein [Terrimesophilobacter mesophilus]
MTCRYCGTTLPPGAMFCGECGRAVTTPAAPAAQSMIPSPLTRSVAEPEPWMNASAGGSASIVCEQCGAPVLPDDIFCGECGFVVRAAAPGAGPLGNDRPGDDRPRDTNSVERLEEVAGDDPAGPEHQESPAEEASPDEDIPVEASPVENSPDDDSPVEASPVEASPVDDSPDEDSPDEDIEPTRIVSRPIEGERFVLQFSTGESFTVYGSGLVGRSPRPEPGEFFDQLVRVVDSSRSVSKTHLEFGQDGGSFWVKDRFSGNGTIVREPDSAPIRCHPDRRYRLVRGSRVDLGEQFFIVS